MYQQPQYAPQYAPPPPQYYAPQYAPPPPPMYAPPPPPLPPPPPPTPMPSSGNLFVTAPAAGASPVFVAQEAVATSKDMRLDVYVYFEYRGHHRYANGQHPLALRDHGAAQPGMRQLRLMIDSTRTAASIRDEVLQRNDIMWVMLLLLLPLGMKFVDFL